MEYLTDGGPFNRTTLQKSALDFEFPCDFYNQQEAMVMQEYVTVVENEDSREDSMLLGLLDNHAGMPQQIASESPLKLEGDKIFGNKGEPIIQAPGNVAPKPIGQVVRNETSYSGQSINVLCSRCSIAYRDPATDGTN